MHYLDTHTETVDFICEEGFQSNRNRTNWYQHLLAPQMDNTARYMNLKELSSCADHYYY